MLHDIWIYNNVKKGHNSETL